MNDQSRRNLRLRFSIANLFLVLAFFVVFISHINTSLELARTRDSLRVAQAELGVLQIDDPRELAALSLPSPSRTQWRWRIQLPTTGTFRLRYVVGSIPQTGLPTDMSQVKESISIFYDERDRQLSDPFVLNAGLAKTEFGTWRIKFSTHESSINPEIKEPPDWLDLNPRPSFTYVAGRSATDQCPPSESLVLLRYYESKDDPTTGVLVWIEPVEHPDSM